jgi:hypothetical protein
MKTPQILSEGLCLRALKFICVKCAGVRNG